MYIVPENTIPLIVSPKRKRYVGVVIVVQGLTLFLRLSDVEYGIIGVAVETISEFKFANLIRVLSERVALFCVNVPVP